MNVADVNVRYILTTPWDIGTQSPLSIMYDDGVYHVSSPVFEQSSGGAIYQAIVVGADSGELIQSVRGESTTRIVFDFKNIKGDKVFSLLVTCTDQNLGTSIDGAARVFAV